MGVRVKAEDNLFEALGYVPEEAANLQMRSILMNYVVAIIRDRGLTQVEAAELFGVKQPRISALVNGRIDLFKIDTLVNMLAAAGEGVSIKVIKRRGAPKPKTVSPGVGGRSLRARRAESRSPMQSVG